MLILFCMRWISRSLPFCLPVCCSIALAQPGQPAVSITVATGTELGAAVAAAVAQLNGTCGDIEIPNGTYTWTTEGVTKLPCQHLGGHGAVVHVGAMTRPFLISAVTAAYPPSPQTYTEGGVDDITFDGPGPNNNPSGDRWTRAMRNQTGLYLGGDLTGAITPAKATSYLEVFSRVHLRHFGCAITFGYGFQDAFFASAIEDNFDGICFDNAKGQGLENLNLHGTQILNNISYGIVDKGDSQPELMLISDSVDYNGQGYSPGGAIYLHGGLLDVFGGHFEGPKESVQITTSSVLKVDGTAFNYTGTDGPLSSFFVIHGVNGDVSLSDLHTDGAFQQVTRLIEWQAKGADNHLFIGKLHFDNQTNLFTLPLFQPGANIQYYDLPVFNKVGDQVGRTVNSMIVPGASSFGDLSAQQLGVGAIRNAPGFQLLPSTPGCKVTAGSVGTTCNAPVALGVQTTSTRYLPVCTLSGAPGMLISGYTNASTQQFTVQESSYTTTATGPGMLQCVVVSN